MEGFAVFESLSLTGAARHFAHFTVEGLLGVFPLMIPGVRKLDPIQEFKRVGASVRGRLTELGLTEKSLFIAAGIDDTTEGCELLFTRVFTRLDDIWRPVQRMESPVGDSSMENAGTDCSRRVRGHRIECWPVKRFLKMLDRFLAVADPWPTLGTRAPSEIANDNNRLPPW